MVLPQLAVVARELLDLDQGMVTILGNGAASGVEDTLDLSSSNALQAGNNAVEMLRAAARSPLRDEHLAYAQICDAMQNAKIAEHEHPRGDLEDWIYALALIYTQHTSLLPAFSNCENETRFERFVHALPAPLGLQFTRNRLKAAIRRLDLKNNPGFARDLNALNSEPAIPGT